ncbi:MAG: FadR/GntR family transcriptional regulator [Desulfovibrionaceae bacterium]
MALKTRKIQRNRMYQDVVAQVETAILDGTLRPGDLLPPELKLKDQLGASRGTVREALRVLEEKGLVEVRPGATGGAFVRHTGVEQLTQRLDLLLQLQKVGLDHLAEFRAAVEGEAARLAARSIDDAGRERIRQAMDRAGGVLRANPDDWRGLLRADIDLHILLAELSGNPVFLAVTRMVHESVLGAAERFSLREPETLAANLADLADLAGAVASGNEERAAHLARAHVHAFNVHLKHRRATKPAPEPVMEPVMEPAAKPAAALADAPVNAPVDAPVDESGFEATAEAQAPTKAQAPAKA